MGFKPLRKRWHSPEYKSLTKQVFILEKVHQLNYGIKMVVPWGSILVEFSRCTHQTSEIGNIGACWNIGESASANRRYPFCKKCKQHATTLKSDTDMTTYIADRHGGVGGLPWRLARASRCGRPPMTLTAVVVGDVGDRPGGRHRDFKENHNCLLSDATVVTRNRSSCYLRVVDGMAALCRRLAICSASFRRQMTIVEIIIADLHCLSDGGRLCVFV